MIWHYYEKQNQLLNQLSPLDCKEIKPVNPKGNQPWIFIGRTDAEAEAPILWPPYGKSWLIRKDLEAAKDWGQEEKGKTEDETVGGHHWLNAHDFEQAPIEGRRRRGRQRMRQLEGITDSMHMTLSKLGRWWRTGKPGILQSTRSQSVEHDWATEQHAGLSLDIYIVNSSLFPWVDNSFFSTMLRSTIFCF